MTMTKDNLFENAIKTMQHAYAPFSHFKVGACLLTEDNRLFSGCNVENASYSLTLCAEASAIANMISAAGVQRIKAILLVSSGKLVCPPCGACRQRLWEFATPECQVYLAKDQTHYQSHRLADLLPLPFDDKQL